MSNTSYKGSYKITVQNNLLSVVASGAWNKKTAIKYVAEFKSQVETFQGKKWGQIVYLDNWILGTPEIEPIIEALAEWNLTTNLGATAFVTNENSLKQYQLENMLADKPDGYQRRYFSDKEEAITWLEQLGFRA